MSKKKYTPMYVQGPSKGAPKTAANAIDDRPIICEMPAFFYLICCDCGLTHAVIVERAGKNKVRLGMLRNDPATSWYRYQKGVKLVKKKKKR